MGPKVNNRHKMALLLLMRKRLRLNLSIEIFYNFLYSMELNIYINIKTDFLVYRMHNKNFKGLFKVTIF